MGKHKNNTFASQCVFSRNASPKERMSVFPQFVEGKTGSTFGEEGVVLVLGRECIPSGVCSLFRDVDDTSKHMPRSPNLHRRSLLEFKGEWESISGLPPRRSLVP
jgi:hypothetical protein